MPIFDQGYQHWKGPLSSHAWRWLAIARHGVRVQAQNRILRVLIMLAWLPALGLVTFVAIWGLVEQGNTTVLPFAQALLPPEILRDPGAFRITVWTIAYWLFFKVEMFSIMLLVVVAGPGLISRDLRFNALPLYFARPLTRFDYFAGKLGVIGALVGAVAILPAFFAYVIGVCFSFDLSVVKDTYTLLLGSMAYGMIVTVSAGMLMLALSSLTRRSLYVGIAWAGLWLISLTVAGRMVEIQRYAVQRGIQEDELTKWVAANPPPAGVQMYGAHPVTTFRPETGTVHLAGLEPSQEEAGEKWFSNWQAVSLMAAVKGQLRQSEALREDWRPLLSYVGNLSRMADLLLDTDTAWVAFGNAVAARLQGPGRRDGPGRPLGMERQLADRLVGQYPWWWSACVLLGLAGISTCILTFRVKSLDRLK